MQRGLVQSRLGPMQLGLVQSCLGSMQRGIAQGGSFVCMGSLRSVAQLFLFVPMNRSLLMWLGRVTHLANTQPGPQRRDSTASRRAAASRRTAQPRRCEEGRASPSVSNTPADPSPADVAYAAAVEAGQARWSALLTRVRAREAAASA